jgi:hypothetical protein
MVSGSEAVGLRQQWMADCAQPANGATRLRQLPRSLRMLSLFPLPLPTFVHITTSDVFGQPALLDATDELGMLVWDENHRNGEFDQVPLLVKRDRNHPSIIIWYVIT